ncbi:fanconi-associated nuclease 1 [Sporobolomyces salmoneus]|uniref:fanconi-associated nuclease 1 n=1 Tax=Sporobolomyces salmoneus TaxID=183962 RepID=UPI003176727C
MTARVGTPPVSIFEKTTDSTCPRSPSTPSTPTSDDNGTREVSTAPPAQRVSFYVQAADDMLEAVFRHEAFLFSPKEQHALRRFQLLDYQSRYLFMRLFLRKHGWIRLDGIGYENDVKDLESACRDLWQKIEFTPSPPAVEETKSELKLEPFSRSSSSKVEDPNVIDLTMSDDEEEDLRTRGTRPTEKKKKLGDCEEDDSNMDLTRLAEDKEVLAVEDPEIALSLLTMEELVALGKRMKVSLPAGKTTRGEWTKALLRTSNQSTLSFFPSQTSTSNAKGKGKQVGFGVGYDTKGNKLKQSSVVARQALKSIGPVIRLSPTYVSLFNRLSLVYHRTSYTATSSQPNKTSSLTASLLARFGKRRYPDYIVSRSFSIFPSRKTLKQFEAAMEIEKKVEESLEGIWGPGVAKRGEKESVDEKRARFLEGAKIWEEVEDEWKELCVEAETEMKAEDDGDERRRLYYRRRFHPGWPLSRAAYKAAACYAKLGDHEREVEILRFLLAQTSFRRGKRGDWYDRLALVLMKYPLGEELVLIKDKESKPKKKERLLRERREEALRVCETGLEDPFTHLIYKSSLQRRIARIESALDVPKDERRSFQVLLTKSKQRTMEGERLDDPTIGKKSLWRATDGDEVSVEELVLEQFHSENGVLTSIFALVFWDIIFAPVDGVFETAFQSAPLDLATDAFAIVRRPAVDARLAAVARGEAATFLKATDDRERPLNTWAVGINWERFSQEDLTEIVDCIGGPALASILTVFVEEYGHRTGGIPDLCLWNPSTSSVLFSEVKGPGDKLSETQKVWIEVLLSSGVGVEVCRVVESRKLDDQAESDGDEGEESEESGGSGKVKKGKGKRKRAAPRSRSRSTSTAVKRAKTEEIELSDSD